MTKKLATKKAFDVEMNLTVEVDMDELTAMFQEQHQDEHNDLDHTDWSESCSDCMFGLEQALEQDTEVEYTFGSAWNTGIDKIGFIEDRP